MSDQTPLDGTDGHDGHDGHDGDDEPQTPRPEFTRLPLDEETQQALTDLAREYRDDIVAKIAEYPLETRMEAAECMLRSFYMLLAAGQIKGSVLGIVLHLVDRPAPHSPGCEELINFTMSRTEEFTATANHQTGFL